MIEEAINYPRNSDAAVKTIIVGGLLTLFGFLLVPAFLVLGYYGRVLQSAGADETEPPVFDEWGDLFVDGLKLFIVNAVYLIIPAIVMAVSVGGVVVAAFTGSDVAVWSALGGALLGFSVAGLLFLVAWYIVPAAMANYVRTDRLGSAFAFGELKPVLLSGDYAVAWLLALGVFLAGAIVIGLLNVIPLVGALVGVFVNFYAGVVAFYLYGNGFAEAATPKQDREAPSGRPVV